MPPRRFKRKGRRQRFYARNALIAFSSEVDTGSREENASKNLTTFDGVWAFDAFVSGRSGQFPLYAENSAGAGSFVDEVCGTLARLCAYLMTLALMAIGGIALWDHLPVTAMETSPKTWSQAERTAPAFAVSQLIFPARQRLTRSFGIPRAAARTSSAGAASAARRSPNSKSIVRAKKSIRSARRPATLRQDGPGWPARAGSGGIIDSKFGAVTLFAGSAARSRPRLPAIFQACR